jgi:aminoglycoside phosphotransferase (APT) family kinase protein
LRLDVFDRAWLDAHIDALVAAAAGAMVTGSALQHGDVRSDNLCIADDGVVLVDWNLACRARPILDFAAWLPSLRHEGGPEPWTLPGHGSVAALLAGYFLGNAGREPISQAPHVRQLQLDQGRAALAWACHELGISAPR